MISKRNKDNSTACSHPVTKHEFEDNKYVGDFSCFIVTNIHVLRSNKGSHRLDLEAHMVTTAEEFNVGVTLNFRSARTP